MTQRPVGIAVTRLVVESFGLAGEYGKAAATINIR
jgi:hypothetical protein